MKRIITCLLVAFSCSACARSQCNAPPNEDFSKSARAEISSKAYVPLGRVQDQCWYFRDIVFKNGHGQQAIVGTSRTNHCVGFYRVSLAKGARLRGMAIEVTSSKDETFKLDLTKGIPKTFFFDGEATELEACPN